MRTLLLRSIGIVVSSLLLIPALPLLAQQVSTIHLNGAGGIAVLGLGFLLGLKHALDADHLVAISTIVSERNSIRSASWTGAMWGLGHTLSLLIMGVLVVALRVKIPEAIGEWLELSVAVMIVGLGINLLWQILRHGGVKLHAHTHSHGELLHDHPHLHFPDGFGEGASHHHPVRAGRKPLLVGMVHGLAGSAALMLLVLAEISSPILGIFYIVIFGIGSVGGMIVMSILFSIPFRLLTGRAGNLQHALRLASGVFSILFGAYMIWSIGSSGGLF